LGSALAERAEAAHKRLTEIRGETFLPVITGLKDRKRTLFALCAASVISVVLWGLVVALHVR
jgi:hypothetical protein